MKQREELQVNSVLTHGNKHLEAEDFPYRYFRPGLEQPRRCSAASVLSTCCPRYLQTACSRGMFVQGEPGR